MKKFLCRLCSILAFAVAVLNIDWTYDIFRFSISIGGGLMWWGLAFCLLLLFIVVLLYTLAYYLWIESNSKNSFTYNNHIDKLKYLPKPGVQLYRKGDAYFTAQLLQYEINEYEFCAKIQLGSGVTTRWTLEEIEKCTWEK